MPNIERLEAVGRERRGPKGEPKQADAATLAALFAALNGCPEKRERINPRTLAVTRDAERSALFETLDAAREGAMVHENLIAK